MKYGKIVLYGVGGLFLLFLAFVFIAALFLPSDYEVKRSIRIERPPEPIYEKITDLEEWKKWNPWSTHVDSNIYKGPSSGKGAEWEWRDRELGKGSLLITKAEPYRRVETRIFSSDSLSTDQGIWILERKGSSTKVVWKKSGTLSYPFQRILLWIEGPDRLIGKDLQKGLENLKGHLEEGVRLNAEL